MTSRNALIRLSIAVVFITNFRDVSTMQAEVESRLVCSSFWQKLELNWNFLITNLSSHQSFNSFWSQNEVDFKNQTANKLSSTVIYARNFTKIFSCYGTVAKHVGSLVTWRNNVSFNVQLAKLSSELLGVRYVSLPKDETRLEFYLKTRTNIGTVDYSASYCWINPFPELTPFSKSYSCPRYKSVQFICTPRKEYVYRIPDSVGLICKTATTDYVNSYSTYKFIIRSTTRDGFTSSSAEFRVDSLESTDEPATVYAYQGLFTTVLIGQKPGYLTADTTTQRVMLEWESTGADSYRVNYSCSNGVNASKDYENTPATIYNEHFAPDTPCKFCVSSQASAGSLYSAPTCNTTRFPEKSPSKPPRITCDYSTCPTKSYDQRREVTVECEFPPRQTRHGRLNKLVINYWNDTSEPDNFQTFITTNLTTCRTTLTGLSQKHNYYAQMSVCNSKGCSVLSDRVSIALGIYTNIKNGQTNHYWLLFLILLPVSGGIIMLSWYVLRRSIKPSQKQTLPEVEEPNCYENLEANSSHQLNHYDELPKEEGSENLVGNPV